MSIAKLAAIDCREAFDSIDEENYFRDNDALEAMVGAYGEGFDDNAADELERENNLLDEFGL